MGNLYRLRLPRWSPAAAVAFAFIALFATAGIARADSFQWSAPTGLAGSALVGVSCPSASQCTSITTTGEVTFNPQTGVHNAVQSLPGASHLTAISCPAANQCTAVDSATGNYLTFGPGKPGANQDPNMIETFGADRYFLDLVSVSCSSTTVCATVDGNTGIVYTFDPQTWGATDGQVDGYNHLVSVACPTTAQCTAIDANGTEITFDLAAPWNHTWWGMEPAGATATAIVCPSAGKCTLVDGYGNEVTFNPAHPSLSTSSRIDTGGNDIDYPAVNAIDCLSATTCTAVDEEGREATFNPQTPPANPAPVAVDGAALLGVACKRSAVSHTTLHLSQCVAVDAAGDMVRGAFTS
jgi:hypothetical protein